MTALAVARTPDGLFGRIIAPANLHAAWRKVRANKGAAGADGVTIEAFERKLDAHLSRLARDLASGAYRPGRLRRFAIRKAGGGVRRLAIPSVVDRVAQTAANLVLTPEIDGRMHARSHAYRPGRGVADAIGDLVAAMAQGRWFIVDLDISAYFDSIPHRRLIAELAIWIEDARALALLVLWVRSFSAWGRGISQGAPISPLLANLYLHPVDQMLAIAGHVAIRYADDMALACRDRPDAERALALARTLLAERGLRVNAAKTKLLAPDEDFTFLGAQIGRS